MHRAPRSWHLLRANYHVDLILFAVVAVAAAVDEEIGRNQFAGMLTR